MDSFVILTLVFYMILYLKVIYFKYTILQLYQYKCVITNILKYVLRFQ